MKRSQFVEELKFYGLVFGFFYFLAALVSGLIIASYFLPEPWDIVCDVFLGATALASFAWVMTSGATGSAA